MTAGRRIFGNSCSELVLACHDRKRNCAKCSTSASRGETEIMESQSRPSLIRTGRRMRSKDGEIQRKAFSSVMTSVLKHAQPSGCIVRTDLAFTSRV